MIKEINMEDIPVANRRRGQRAKEITDFIESGASAAEVFSDTTKNGLSLYASCLTTIQRLRLPASVIRRGERVFLIREAPNGPDTH